MISITPLKNWFVCIEKVMKDGDFLGILSQAAYNLRIPLSCHWMFPIINLC